MHVLYVCMELYVFMYCMYVHVCTRMYVYECKYCMYILLPHLNSLTWKWQARGCEAFLKLVVILSFPTGRCYVKRSVN